MSDLLQRIDRLYELDAEPLMFAVGASALLIECRTQIESLQRENEQLRATIDKLKAERDPHLRLRKMNAKLEPSGGGGGVGITEGKPKSW